MAGDCIRLTAVERVKIELGLRDGLSLTAIAAELGRPKGTMSKEIARNGGRDTYDAGAAHIRMENAPRGGRRNRLSPGEPLFAAVACLLRKRWSPGQIAGGGKGMTGRTGGGAPRPTKSAARSATWRASTAARGKSRDGWSLAIGKAT